MIDRNALVHAIELRKEISERNSQAFVDLPYEMVGNVIALLKEQEAVKPIKTWELNNLSMAIDIYLCGNCKEEIVGKGKYCSNCGRPVLWEGR